MTVGKRLAAGSAIATSVGGVTTAIASLMSWSSFDSTLFSLYSVSGIALGYGVPTLLAGIGLTAIGLYGLHGSLRPRLPGLAITLAVVAVVVPVIARIELDLRGSEGPFHNHPAGLALGIYITELGGLVALLGSIGLHASHPRREEGRTASSADERQ